MTTSPNIESGYWDKALEGYLVVQPPVTWKDNATAINFFWALDRMKQMLEDLAGFVDRSG